jgi:hypothetical protein
MIEDDFIDIPKTDETQQSTPEEQYFSRSKNTWLYVSDMSDMHVRRAFKRLLRMIRLGQLIELSDYQGQTNKNDIQVELNAIENHIFKIRDKLND